ncbi:P1 family peptidase [Isoptericola sp. NPDC019482]|uniref:P1 family peptidase n=1 Tax=Isoptericola sp. NPDC019482 TaxID=3154688 RepID=UPI0034913DD1
MSAPVAGRPGPRDLGVVVGDLPTGPANAITDVAGVRVGHTTLHEGERLHTGITAVVPDALGAGPGQRRALPCGLFVGNGYGKLVGATQLEQLGSIETPILLTATLSAFRAADALVTHVLAWPGYEDVRTLNPVVGETNDGFLSDIRARPITEAHALAALDGATSGPVAQGCVGAGAGTSALGYKGGIGTSSRRVDVAGTVRTVGALVQSNFSGTLTVRGVPLPAADLLGTESISSAVPPAEGIDGVPKGSGPAEGNSCMIVVATDAPLDARRLERVARRAVFAMGRVGSDFAHGSGDYGLALTTADPGDGLVPDDALDPLFAATTEAVEEALLASVFTATTVVGHRGTRHALPHDAALDRLRAAGWSPGRTARDGGGLRA